LIRVIFDPNRGDFMDLKGKIEKFGSLGVKFPDPEVADLTQPEQQKMTKDLTRPRSKFLILTRC